MMKLAPSADIVLGTDGRMYVNSAFVPVAERLGRRVLRVVELTPGEVSEVMNTLGQTATELLAGVLPAKMPPRKRRKAGRR
jgi:hypothetical protein